MEPLIRMVEVCSEEDVDIPDSGMLNVEKKVGQKDFNGDDSTTEESIGQNEAYHIESGEHDESSEESASKAISRRMERKRNGSHVFDGEGAVYNQSTKRAQSKRRSDGPLGKRMLFLFCLQLS